MVRYRHWLIALFCFALPVMIIAGCGDDVAEGTGKPTDRQTAKENMKPGQGENRR